MTSADDEQRRYAAARAAGIAAAKRAWPLPVLPMPIDLAARFLPEHPEWARSAPKRLRRGKPVRP